MNLLQLTAKLVLDSTAYEKGIANAKSAIEELGDSSGNIGSKISSIGDAITSVGYAFIGLSTTAAEAFGYVIGQAETLEDGMAKMSTLFDTNVYSTDDLKESYMQLSSQLGISVGELEEAGYQAISAGQSVEDSVEMVRVAGELAVAGFTETNTAVDLLTTVLNSYADENYTAEQAANALLETQNLGKTVVGQLNTAIGRVIPTASSFGVSLEDLSGEFIVLTKNGIQTRYAGTYLSSMFSELGDSGSGVNEKLAEVSGMTFPELMANGYSVADAIDFLSQSVDGDSTAFYNLWDNQNAAKAASKLLQVGTDELRGSVTSVTDAMNGAGTETSLLGEAFDKMSSTPSYNLNEVLNNINLIAGQLGDTFLTKVNPYIEQAADFTSDLAYKFMEMDEDIQFAIVTITGLVAAFAPVMIVGGQVVKLFGTAVDNFIQFYNWGLDIINAVIGPLQTFFSALFETMSTGIPTMIEINGTFMTVGDIIGTVTSVFTTFVPIITAVIAVGVSLYEHWTLVKEKAEELWDAIVQAFNGIRATISECIETYIMPIFESFKGTIESLGEIWSRIWNVISDVIMTVYNIIMEVVTILVQTFSEVWPIIAGYVESAFSMIASVYNNVLQPVFDLLIALLGDVATVFEELWPGIQNVVETVFQAIKVAWEYVLKPALEAVLTAGELIWEFMSGLFSDLLSLFGGLIESLRDLWQRYISPVVALVAEIFSALFTTVSGTVKDILDWVSDKFEGIYEAIKKPMESARDLVKGIIDRIKQMFDFTVSWPEIKVPHFSISPSNWSLGDLLKGEIPTLGIDWYAKAMDNGMILNGAQIFGAADGHLLGGGEKGSETVVGTGTLMNMIQDASNNGNYAIVSILEQLLYNITGDGLKTTIMDAVEEMEFKVGDREFARLVRKYA